MSAILLALLAGVLTIAAPCVLPVLPALLGATVGRAGRYRPAFIALGFVVSFAGAVLVFASVTSAFGIDHATLRIVAAAVLTAFGVAMVWPGLFDRIAPGVAARLGARSGTAIGDRRGNRGGFLLGTSLGLVWTPCAGPVLGSILTLIATAPDLSWGAVLLAAYAVGAALPMLAVGYGGRAISERVRSIAPISHRLQQGFGVLVIAFAAATLFDYDTAITAWLSHFYPNGNIGL